MSLLFLKTRRFLKTDTFGLKADSHLHKLRFVIVYKTEINLTQGTSSEGQMVLLQQFLLLG